MLFSEREEAVPPRLVQGESLDGPTRNRITNYVGGLLKPLYEYPEFLSILTGNVVDRLGHLNHGTTANLDNIIDIIQRGEWNHVYDVLELLIQGILSEGLSYNPEDINRIMKEENTGYRLFLARNEESTTCTFSPIANDLESRTIQNAVSTEYEAVNEHVAKSLRLFSDRKSPDYANAVKEAISAIESLCKSVLGERSKSPIGDLFKRLESNGHNIHKSLQLACEKLYGYASDANNVRHGGDKPSDITVDDALFMIVTCSALVNYFLCLLETPDKD